MLSDLILSKIAAYRSGMVVGGFECELCFKVVSQIGQPVGKNLVVIIHVISKPLDMETGVFINLVIHPGKEPCVFGQHIPSRKDTEKFIIALLTGGMRRAKTPVGLVIDAIFGL